MDDKECGRGRERERAKSKVRERRRGGFCEWCPIVAADSEDSRVGVVLRAGVSNNGVVKCGCCIASFGLAVIVESVRRAC